MPSLGRVPHPGGNVNCESLFDTATTVLTAVVVTL
jgi:hypothetical protein